MGKVLIIKGIDFSQNAVDNIDFIINKITISVLSSNNEYGTVTGSGSFYEGKTINISAKPKPGYKFIKWSDGNTNYSREIIVGGTSETYTAIFEQGEYIHYTFNNTINKVFVTQNYKIVDTNNYKSCIMNVIPGQQIKARLKMYHSGGLCWFEID